MVVYCHVGARHCHYCPLKCKQKDKQGSRAGGGAETWEVISHPACQCSSAPPAPALALPRTRTPAMPACGCAAVAGDGGAAAMLAARRLPAPCSTSTALASPAGLPRRRPPRLPHDARRSHSAASIGECDGSCATCRLPRPASEGNHVVNATAASPFSIDLTIHQPDSKSCCRKESCAGPRQCDHKHGSKPARNSSQPVVVKHLPANCQTHLARTIHRIVRGQAAHLIAEGAQKYSKGDRMGALRMFDRALDEVRVG